MYFLSLFLCWCDNLSWCIVQHCTFHHGQQKSPKKQVLHLTCWALCVDHTMLRNLSVNLFFPECSVFFFGATYHLVAPFQLFASSWWFEQIENGRRLAISDAKERELNRTLWLVSWSKTWTPIGCGTTNTTEMKKTKTCSLLLVMPTHTHEIENEQFVFRGGARTDMIMSVAAECSAFGHSELRPKRRGWQLCLCVSTKQN